MIHACIVWPCELDLIVLIGFKVKFTVILDGAGCEFDRQQNLCSIISFCYQFINASSGHRYRLRLRLDEQFLATVHSWIH